jgi:diguanylate cyclase (GGDEF)-like protein
MEASTMDILVINTDLVDRSVIEQVLEREHKVSFIENIADAWKLIADGRFRFIIADATAHTQNIYQLIQQVHSHSDTIGLVYFLLLAKKGQSENLSAVLKAGADDYLNSPIVPQELKTRVSVGARILSMGDTLTQARDQLESVALYDTPTGLMSQQAFYKVAQGELERARRGSNVISAIAMDINNFQAINNQHGHAIGNDVLQIIAQVIREKSRPYDCIGRWEGGQFFLILPGVVSSDAEKIANRILKGVQASQISLPDNTELEVELSAGIASAQNINVYAEIDFFIQSAIQALNNSKQDDKEKIGVLFV